MFRESGPVWVFKRVVADLLGLSCMNLGLGYLLPNGDHEWLRVDRRRVDEFSVQVDGDAGWHGSHNVKDECANGRRGLAQTVGIGTRMCSNIGWNHSRRPISLCCVKAAVFKLQAL